MPHHSRPSSTSRPRVALQVEPLEQRTLLNGASTADAAKSSRGVQEVSIQVPSPYLSQQASVLPVTLVRTAASGHGRVRGPLTVDFSASVGTLPGNSVTAPDEPGEQFTPINESVTFQDGQTSTTVDVPIHSGAPNPGLVPVALSVESQPRSVDGTNTTVYLAAGPDDVPPFILYVHMINRGIAITFNKPMAPSTVTNIRNYAVKFSPSQKFNLADLAGVGLIQTLNTASQAIALKRHGLRSHHQYRRLDPEGLVVLRFGYIPDQQSSESELQASQSSQSPAPHRRAGQRDRPRWRRSWEVRDHDQPRTPLRGNPAAIHR